MKITTGRGDGGRTRMCGGKAVSKCDIRIKAQGALDELICLLGLAKTKIKDTASKRKIGLIQKDLFRMIACISAGGRKAGGIKDCDVRMLEHFGDSVEDRLRVPSGFVIPGVNEASAFLHVARATARRAECCAVEMQKRFRVYPAVLAYLNRLSDLLFILALYEEGRPELLKR